VSSLRLLFCAPFSVPRFLLGEATPAPLFRVPLVVQSLTQGLSYSSGSKGQLRTWDKMYAQWQQACSKLKAQRSSYHQGMARGLDKATG
jgi:hypothetical protein